ncbi:MAG: ABC transporter permease [Bacteroidaceae bacterium]|nr:ABC transporter permease [Bacteroidaceae bacterium]
MNLAYFMARRLYGQSEGTGRVSRLAVSIATAGVALGLGVMILSVAVVVGFKQEVRDKVTGIGSHLQVLNYESLYRTESQPVALSDSLISSLRSIEGVQSVQQVCNKGGMLKTEEAFQGVVFRGIGEDYDLSFLRQHLVAGALEKPFSSTESSNSLLLSAQLARQLQLGVDEDVYAYFFDNKLRARKFHVTALYETNLEEYDSKLVFCDYKVTHQLLGFEPDQSSGAEVVLRDFAQLDSVTPKVRKVLSHRQDSYGANITAPTICEMYPSIFSWLELLDMNVWVILLLMMAVACFTTISGLLIIILERTQFVGIMKALGAPDGTLRRLFIYYCLLIIGRGILIGNVLGIGLCLLQKYCGVVHLDASTYYVDAVPVLISWPFVLALNIGVLCISVAVLVLPSYVIAHIHPAKSIRFE